MNKIIKKENGVVFTPEWIADFMVEEIFRSRKIKGDEKILDAGCGEGVFSVVAAKKFAEVTGKDIKDIVEENIYFIDISEDYVNKTKDNLQKLSDKKINKFNTVVDDFCFHDFDEKFDFIIGNPPYVRIQNLNGRKERLQKEFITAANGSIDLYFCFFEKALKTLNDGGMISFITPNSHFYSAAGKNLRNLIADNLVKIVNFDHFQVFKDATAYTAITFLQKEISGSLLYTNSFKEHFRDIDYKIISKKGLRSERWEFFDEEFMNKIIDLNKKYSSLKDIADIHYGIATLKDEVYIFSPDRIDNDFYHFNGYKIEKEICVPIIKASTYKGQNQNLFMIFPYENERIIPGNIFQKKYPMAFDYLWKHRSVLESRDKGDGKNYVEFYAFGRSQGLKTSFGKKIITSGMNLSPRFYVVEDKNTSFYAGYCIKPKNGSDIYQLCNALNSELMKEYIDSVSKSYRGGYKSYAKSFLKDFVHPTFDKGQSTLF